MEPRIWLPVRQEGQHVETTSSDPAARLCWVGRDASIPFGSPATTPPLGARLSTWTTIPNSLSSGRCPSCSPQIPPRLCLWVNGWVGSNPGPRPAWVHPCGSGMPPFAKPVRGRRGDAWGSHARGDPKRGALTVSDVGRRRVEARKRTHGRDPARFCGGKKPT